jgi:hypothetical protein
MRRFPRTGMAQDIQVPAIGKAMPPDRQSVGIRGACLLDGAHFAGARETWRPILLPRHDLGLDRPHGRSLGREAFTVPFRRAPHGNTLQQTER